MPKKPKIFNPIGQNESFDDVVKKVLKGGESMDDELTDVDINNILNDSQTEIIPIINFEYTGHKVRTIYKDGEVWFVAKDICELLSIKDTSMALSRLDKADTSSTGISSGGQIREMSIVNESGLYDLLLDSRKKEAKDFRRWVTKDVLPSIRKTGKYEIHGLENLSEEEKRRIIRDEILKRNPIISAEAKRLGVGRTDDKKENSIQFAMFHNAGYKGFYGGMTKKDVMKKKGLPKKDSLLDYEGATALAGHLFRITQAEERLKQQEDNAGIDKANEIHYLAGAEVRKAMIAIHGIPPEDLPVYEKLKLSKSKNNKTITSKNSDNKIEINISVDLWKIALLIMAKNKDGIILTNELMKEVHKYIEFPEKYKEISKIKNEPKYKQIIRNLKSNIKNKTNFVNQGYAISIKNGFQITQKGIDFVKEYFKNYLQ